MALTVGSINLRDAPQSVSQVTKDAQDYEYNAFIPLKYWLRTAAAMIRQVCEPRQAMASGCVVFK